jgi:dipeptide/tripeptide permease
MTKSNDLIDRIEAQGTFLGHPKGLYLLFFTEMWERFSYYGMRAILMLYMTKLWMENGLNIEGATASLIYGYFTGIETTLANISELNPNFSSEVNQINLLLTSIRYNN